MAILDITLPCHRLRARYFNKVDIQRRHLKMKYHFAMRMTGASSQDIGKLYAEHYVVHREFSLFQHPSLIISLVITSGFTRNPCTSSSHSY